MQVGKNLTYFITLIQKKKPLDTLWTLNISVCAYIKNKYNLFTEDIRLSKVCNHGFITDSRNSHSTISWDLNTLEHLLNHIFDIFLNGWVLCFWDQFLLLGWGWGRHPPYYQAILGSLIINLLGPGNPFNLFSLPWKSWGDNLSSNPLITKLILLTTSSHPGAWSKS